MNPHGQYSQNRRGPPRHSRYSRQEDTPMVQISDPSFTSRVYRELVPRQHYVGASQPYTTNPRRKYCPLVLHSSSQQQPASGNSTPRPDIQSAPRTRQQDKQPVPDTVQTTPATNSNSIPLPKLPELPKQKKPRQNPTKTTCNREPSKTRRTLDFANPALVDTDKFQSLTDGIQKAGTDFNNKNTILNPRNPILNVILPCAFCTGKHSDGFCPMRLPPSLRFQQCVMCLGYHPANLCPLAFQVKQLEVSTFCTNCNFTHPGFCQVENFCNNCLAFHKFGLPCSTDQTRIDLATGIDQCLACKQFHLGPCSIALGGSTFRYCNTCKIKHVQGLCPKYCSRCGIRHDGLCSLKGPRWPCVNCKSCHLDTQPCRHFTEYSYFCNSCNQPNHDSSICCEDFQKKPFNFQDKVYRKLKQYEKITEDEFPSENRVEPHKSPIQKSMEALNTLPITQKTRPLLHPIPERTERVATSTPIPQHLQNPALDPKLQPYDPERSAISFSDIDCPDISNIANISTLCLDQSTVGDSTLEMISQELDRALHSA